MVSVLGWIFKRQKSKSPSISQEVMNTNKLLIKKIGHLVDIIKDQESFNSKNTFINSYQEFLEFDCKDREVWIHSFLECEYL